MFTLCIFIYTYSHTFIDDSPDDFDFWIETIFLNEIFIEKKMAEKFG